MSSRAAYDSGTPRLPRRGPIRRRRRVAAAAAGVSVTASLLAACASPAARTASLADPPAEAAADLSVPRAVADAASGAAGDTVTRLAMRNVRFVVGSGIALDVRRLRGQMRSKTPGGVVVFDDKRAFTIHIDSAEVALGAPELSNLLNGYVFAYPGAPLRELRVRTAGDAMVLRGVLHKVIDIPFEITAAPSLTEEGLIRIHPRRIRIASLDGAGLLRAVHLQLDRLMDLRKSRGASVQGNDVILDPARMLPPPAIVGHVGAVRVEGPRVVIAYVRGGAGRAAAAASGDAEPPDAGSPNYLYFRGGTLRFGKLFMVRADMQIVDEDPTDPFEFSVDDYNRQLVAGYSRNTPAMGLVVHMPDLGDVGRERVVGQRK